MIYSIAIGVLGLTIYGIYVAFGPPSKHLSDPIDDHDD